MQRSITITVGFDEALYKKLKSKETVWLLLTAGLLFALFAAGFALIQYATPALAGNDGYYHIKMGYLLRTQGLKPAFTYLPLTILNEQAYYDHHLLYHAWLALFATTDPAVDGGQALLQGAKLASILMPSLAFVAVWWLFNRQGIRFAAVWTIALFAISEAFLYRMSMPRAQALSLLLLVLGIHWLLQEKRWLLLFLGFVYVWAYNAFPLLLVAAVIYAIATFMTERRIVWQLMVFPLVGILLGLIINPYFPQNIGFIAGHLAPKLGDSATKVGNEWDPYSTWTLVENSAGALALFLGGILALAWQEQRIDKRTLFALGLVVLFGYMLFESRRFIEYFPPFVLIFFVFAVAPHLANLEQSWPRSAAARWSAVLPVLLVLLLIWPLFATLAQAKESLADSKPVDLYAQASLWLVEHADDNARIFQTDWDDFTRLFYYNSHASYTAGLDPTFMELQDPELFAEWVDITRGRVENPAAVIAAHFGGDYVFSDLNHESFMEVAADDPHLIEVYRDEYAVIYQVEIEP